MIADISQMLDVLSHHLTKENIHTDAFVLKRSSAASTGTLWFCVFVRLENVGRLKKLEYLNLALNNIEVIENLEGQCIAYVRALIRRLFFCL